MWTCLEHSSPVPCRDHSLWPVSGLGLPGSGFPSTAPAYHSSRLRVAQLLAPARCPGGRGTLTPDCSKSPSSHLGVKLILYSDLNLDFRSRWCLETCSHWSKPEAQKFPSSHPPVCVRHQDARHQFPWWWFSFWLCNLWPEVRTLVQAVGVTSSVRETILCFPFSSYPITMWVLENTPVQTDCRSPSYLITIYTTSRDHPFTFT